MPTLRVEAAIIDNGRILLVQDRRTRCWRMPGGEARQSLSPASSLVQIAKEETGFDIRMGRLIGIYSRPRWRAGGDVSCLFSGLTLTRRPSSPGRVETAFFLPGVLPRGLYPWQAVRVEDAFSSQQRPQILDQETIWPFATDDPERVLDSLAAEGFPDRESAVREVTRRLNLELPEEDIAYLVRNR